MVIERQTVRRSRAAARRLDRSTITTIDDEGRALERAQASLLLDRRTDHSGAFAGRRLGGVRRAISGAGRSDEMVGPSAAAVRWTGRARRGRSLARDGVFLTPATYFIPPEQIGEYQSRIIEAFGPT